MSIVDTTGHLSLYALIMELEQSMGEEFVEK